MADIRGLNPIGRDIQGLTGGRAFGQGASQYKMAGDLAKQQGQTQRQGRDLALKEQSMAFAKSLQEQQEDIKLAQQYAKEDVNNMAKQYQEQWSYLLRDLSDARNVAAEQLSLGLTDEAKQSAISGMFSGAGNIINNVFKYSQGDTGFSGQMKEERLGREAEQDKLLQYEGKPVYLGSTSFANLPFNQQSEPTGDTPINEDYFNQFGYSSNPATKIQTYADQYQSSIPQSDYSKEYFVNNNEVKTMSRRFRKIFGLPEGQ